MNKVTIKDIAKLAGVTPATVSLVINGKNGIAEDTRKKILEIVKQTNYVPSRNSRRLFFKKSFNISIVIKRISSPFDDLFYFEITKGILENVSEYGYNLVFTDMDIMGGSGQFPSVIQQNDTDGVIFYQSVDSVIIESLNNNNIPFVVTDCHKMNANMTCVNADYKKSAYTATKYLIENGHRDIAYMSSGAMTDYYISTFSGFKKAMGESSISIPANWIQAQAPDENSIHACMDDILYGGPSHPSAVFCSADRFAISAMNYVQEKGFEVPGDISFIGIDDIILSQYVRPRLTTVKIDKLDMGRIAIELLMKKINGEPVESVIVGSDNLIVRESVSAK